MKKTKIAIAGLGCVGQGVINILQANKGVLEKRTNCHFDIVGVTARRKEINRECDISPYQWFDTPQQLLEQAKPDIFVEVIGGEAGIAKDSVEQAIKNKINTVTANKALLSKHGNDLNKLAHEYGVDIGFEAAIAGGIPIVKAIREAAIASQITSIHGILNGTCNFILSKMRTEKKDFLNVLNEAQQLGYAEADPTFDIDGIDAAHKISLLSALAFGCEISFESVSCEGIRNIHLSDIEHAEELGYRIKLLAIAEQFENGEITQSVEPVMVPMCNPLAAVEDVFNAVEYGDVFNDNIILQGRGAGAGPTATSVVADICDIACGHGRPLLNIPANDVKEHVNVKGENRKAAYYFRLEVLDIPGVLADISTIFRDIGLSISSLIQHGESAGMPVSVIITTHMFSICHLPILLEKINALSYIQKPTTAIRIGDFE